MIRHIANHIKSVQEVAWAFLSDQELRDAGLHDDLIPPVQFYPRCRDIAEHLEARSLATRHLLHQSELFSRDGTWGS